MKTCGNFSGEEAGLESLGRWLIFATAKWRKRHTLFTGSALLVGLLACFSSHGQSGSVDAAFDIGSGLDGVVFGLVAEPDGGVIAAGSFSIVNGTNQNNIARLTSTGSFDASFNPADGPNSGVRALVRQTDGKLVIGGYFTMVAGVERNGIARLNTNGTVDTNFHPALEPSHSVVTTIALQSDGRILLAGSFSNVNGTARSGLARLNGDGTLDSSFNAMTAASSGIEAMALDSSGRILVGGYFEAIDGIARNGVARLNTNGSLDNSFVPGIAPAPAVEALALQTDGKVLVGGYGVTFGGLLRRIARLNDDGSVDPGFNPGSGFTGTAYASSSSVRALAVQTDGKILVGGDFAYADGIQADRLARLHTNGSVDVGFDPGSFGGPSSSACVCALDSKTDGRLLVGGNFQTINGTSRAGVARLLMSDGNLAGRLEFDSGLVEVNESSGAATVTVVRQRSTNGTATIRYATASYSAEAGADFEPISGMLTFAPGESMKSFQVSILNDSIQEDGEGFSVTLASPNEGARLGLQSSVAIVIVDDDSVVEFGSPTYTVTENQTNAAISVQRRGVYSGAMTVTYSASSGTATAGVDFQSVTGVLEFRQGELTKTFAVTILPDTEVELNETIQLTLIEPTAPVVLGGQATAVLTIVEIGAVDTSFNPGAGPDNRVESLAICPGGTILVGGSLIQNVVGFSRPGLARLHPNGALDEIFIPMPTDRAQAAVIASDGFVYVRSGEGLNTRIERLHPDGSRDLDYMTPFPFAEEFPLAAMPDGKLLEYRIYSNFNDPPGFVTNRLLRLNRYGTADTAFAEDVWIEHRMTLRPSISVLRIEADGKLLAGGRFTHVAGTPRSGLARFHANGSLDTEFSPTLDEWGAVTSMDLLACGRILIGGDFTNVNGVVRIGLARLHADGTLDDDFEPAIASGSSVDSILALPGGKSIVTGDFLGVNPRRRIGSVLRLKADGSSDPDFYPSAECCLFSLALQSDGNVLAAGSFLNLQGTTNTYLARLKSEPGSGAGAIEFTSQTWTVEEGNAFLTLGVRRTGGSNGVVTINYASILRSASAKDYEDVSGVITFADGDATNKSIVIPILDDTEPEDDKTFTVNLANPIGGAQLGATTIANVTLLDDDDCNAIFRYTPLHDGDWKEFSAGIETLSLSVSSTTLNGLAAMNVMINDEQTYYAHSGNQLITFGGAALGFELLFDAPLVELDEQVLLYGGTRTSKSTGSVAGVTIIVTLKVTVTDAGTVTVPAGTFENCRQVTITSTVSIPGTRSETTKQAYVLAPGVGQIRISAVDALTRWADLTSGMVGGTTVSDLAAQTVFKSPKITTQPQIRDALSGSSATFQISAEGSGVLSYQWMKNGTNLAISSSASGVNTATLVLDGVELDDGGLYSVAINSIVGCITSTGAMLTVIPDRARPSLAITTPRPNSRTSNAVTLVEGKATDKARVAQVFYQMNENPWETATGTTNWQASVELIPGTNLFRAYAIDPSRNVSTTNLVQLIFVVTSPLDLSVSGEGSVSPDLDGQLLEVGRAYTVTASPARGWLFSNWVGVVESTLPKLTFTMSSNLTLHANFVTNPFAGLKGNYAGLFYDTNDPSHFSAGFFTLTLTDKGSFSGKLRQGAAKYSYSGQFDLALAAQKTVLRKGTNELLISLQLAGGSDRLIGVVSNAAWSSELFGYRADFNSKSNPATNFQGNYTLLLPDADDSANGPVGHGFAQLGVNSVGSVSFKGTSGDGSAAVQKVPLAANGQWPLYVGLYSGKGSVFGWLTLFNTPTNDVIGPVLWTKPSGVKGPLHCAGFTNELESMGSRYVAPASGTRVLDFTSAGLVLGGGNLPATLTNAVILSVQNKVTAEVPNTQKLSLTLSVSSGSFKGSFVHPQTRKPSAIKGVLLQKQNFGAGFFPGTNQSGHVFFGELDSD